MRRALALLFVLILPTAALLAQSLAELAEDAKKKRKKATPVYTDDDLKKRSPAGDASPGPSAVPGRTAAPSGGAESGGSSVSDGGEGDEGGGPGGGRTDEAYWRDQAASLRRAIKSAEQRIASAQSRVNALIVDAVPTNVSDPFRLETLEAEKAKARQELEEAEVELERAEDALDAFEEDARKKGVRPGWLREP